MRARQDDKWKIFSGTANDALARDICTFLGLQLGQACISRFSDGETYVQIEENVRGADVFMVQPTCDPVDLHLMQLLLLIDALKRASARRITVVIPYFGYARQDRKDKPRVPISSKLVADLLTTAGADRALVVDLHAPQIQGFFNIPVDHVFASPVLVDYFRKKQFPDLTVVSPDAGGVERARFFAKKMESALAIVDKRRVETDVTEVMHVIGDVTQPHLSHPRRHYRYRRYAGEDLPGIAGRGRAPGLCLRHSSGTFRAGGGTDFAVGVGRSGGDQHHPADGSGAQRAQDQSAVDRGIDRAHHSVDSRGDFGQQIVFIKDKIMATATADKNVEAKPRQGGGKNDARRLRASGMIPAVVYGAGQPAQAIAVDPKQMRRILNSETGHNSIFDLSLDGQAAKVMIVDWQFEPIKSALLHVDLKRIAMDKVLRVSVPIVLKGEAPGVKLQGGILEQMLREVEIECLPGDIPGHLVADASTLEFGQTIRVSDLAHDAKVKFITDENQAVAHVTAVKEVVEAAPVEGAVEAEATAAEPEVIKKGKQETEGEAAEGGDKAAKPEKAEKSEKSEKKK